MKTRLLILLALIAIMFLTACAMNIPVAATSNPVGSKVGVHTQRGILVFPPMMNNDSAILQAAKNGGITRISTVDFNQKWMIFYIDYETVVTGE